MRLLLGFLVYGVSVVLAAGSTASAHETSTAGPLRLSVGWGMEPAYTGSANFVEVEVADASGAPVPDVGASLTTEVVFGEERTVLPLVPGDTPGSLRAVLVPTRAGTYTFRVGGQIQGQVVDITSTCSDTTFDCVLDASEIQFPAQEPSAGQLTERVARELGRASRARAEAADARRLAIGAGVVSVVALAVAAVATVSARRARRLGGS